MVLKDDVKNSHIIWIQLLCRHATSAETFHKKITINVHVDDELIASENQDDLLWVVSELKKIHKLQVELESVKS